MLHTAIYHPGERAPKRIQDARLPLCKGGDVCVPAQPFDYRGGALATPDASKERPARIRFKGHTSHQASNAVQSAARTVALSPSLS